jgi:hypothetical protein
MAKQSMDELIQQLEMLRVQEDTLLWQIIQARVRESQQGHGTNGTRETARYYIGDCVRITNPTHGLIGRPVTDRDRVGTVTKITRKRVFLQTDNGINTNRSSSIEDSKGVGTGATTVIKVLAREAIAL